MTSEEDRKLLLLETLVNNQKHMIELLSILNNNVEELILDLKDIKTTNMASTSNNCNQNENHINKKHQMNQNNSNCSTNNNNNNSNSSSNEMMMNSNHIHIDAQSQLLNQSQISLNTIDGIDIDTKYDLEHNNLSVSRQNFIDTNDNRLENISPNNDSYKTVKTGLREFSTFVSKMVRQEFGCNFLALTRINELDRYTMQRIRDEAISKYLPNGISPQFAWNHAMNSLRQLRHRQCKKAKLPL